jgi:hypothetical protein
VRGGCSAEGLVPCKPSWKGQKAKPGLCGRRNPKNENRTSLCVESDPSFSPSVNVLITDFLAGRALWSWASANVCDC